MTAADEQSPGNRRLLRRLLAVAPEPAATGTRQLEIREYPGAAEVTEATKHALNIIGSASPGLETRVLFGTHRSMATPLSSDNQSRTLDLRTTLSTSIGDLVKGTPVLATDVESRLLIARLDLSPDATLVYLFPLMANGALGGMIVVARDSGLARSTHDALKAIASQSSLLLLTLQEAEGLRQREAGFRAMVQNSSDILLVVHPNMTIVDLAPTASGMLGFNADDLLGASLATVLDPRDVGKARDALNGISLAAGVVPALHWRLRHRDGTLIHVDVVANNLLDDPGVAGIVLSARNVSERKALEANMLYQVLHDDLTGLPNRKALLRILEHALTRSSRGGHALAVLFLDLDRFKVVNDSLGHEAGDKLLIQVAKRLKECVRPEDTVARLSGDEFVVLVDHISGPEPAFAVAEKIIHRIKEAIRVDTYEVFVSTSIGIAIERGGTGGVNTATILRNADLAMYESKSRGRCRYSLYQPAMTERAVGRLALETELRRAISNDEFQIHYQPLIDLQSGQVNEVEALMRWMHPTRGLLLPDAFIGLAEETGLIEPIGQWVLEESCRQARLWQEQRRGEPPMNLSVNLSVRQFQQRELVRDVQRALHRSGMNPGELTLEITESVAVEDAEAAVATMRELKKLGVQLALDDFGTGFSALSYLKQFPVDSLKIDRSFVEGLNHNHGDMAIVKAVIAFARTLNLRVTAEGVETVEQLHQLKMLGCDLGQGYYFANPLPGDAITLDRRYATGRLQPRDIGPNGWTRPIARLA